MGRIRNDYLGSLYVAPGAVVLLDEKHTGELAVGTGCGLDMPLSQSTWSSFMINPDREIRRRAYEQFYGTYKAHEQTIAALYEGSVKQDVFNSRIRGFDTALDRALYRDDVPKSVYTGLIEAVHKAFPALHRYYALRKKILGLDELRHYDVYVPLVGSIKTHKTYEEAAEIVREALAPLGEDYVKTIYKGITTDRWVDRYENKGKRSETDRSVRKRFSLSTRTETREE